MGKFFNWFEELNIWTQVVSILVIIAIIICSILYFSRNRLTEGVVIGHKFEPQHSYTTFTYVNNMMIPQVNFIPDQWFITIKGEYNGKERIEDFEVSQDKYYSIKVGQYISVNDK